MTNPSFYLYSLLIELDDFIIEEAKDIDSYVYIERLKKVNTGNNCLHYILIKNKNRIVIQTYKEMNHDKVDIVQGNVNSEEIFQKIEKFINDNHWWLSDQVLNNIFINFYNHRKNNYEMI